MEAGIAGVSLILQWVIGSRFLPFYLFTFGSFFTFSLLGHWLQHSCCFELSDKSLGSKLVSWWTSDSRSSSAGSHDRAAMDAGPGPGGSSLEWFTLGLIMPVLPLEVNSCSCRTSFSHQANRPRSTTSRPVRWRMESSYLLGNLNRSGSSTSPSPSRPTST